MDILSDQEIKNIPLDLSNRIDHVFQLQKKNVFELRNTPPSVRLAKLNKIKNWIYENKNKIRNAVFADFKKPAPEADITEIFISLSEIKHAIRHLKKWMKPKRIRRTLPAITSRSYIRYESKGVVLIISPWNFPFMLAIGPLVSAIAAGNCVILKPSELSPNASHLLSEMIRELFPENEVAVFDGDKEVATELLKKPFDHIFFTGSTRVGKIVMKAAAENLSSVTLEMGGKNPLVLDETCHIPDAVKKIIAGKFSNAGQMCICPDNIYIHKSKYQTFLEALKSEIQNIYGKSKEERLQNSDYARIIDDNHFKRLAGLISYAEENSARIEVGGDIDNNEKFVSPTILTDVDQNSELFQEEIFGPILPLTPYDSLDEVINIFANQPIPLTVYIFSRNNKNIKKIIRNTSSGNCSINEIGLNFFHLNFPFGGRSQSGMGNSHGYYGFRTFSHERPVLKQSRFSPLKLIYPPYTKITRKIIDFVVKYL